MSYIKIRDIEKSFGSVAVLNKISLNIEKGKMICLLGPSGSGKSTLLRIIAGLEVPDSGKLEIDGKDVLSTLPKDRDIGMVFQSYVLFPNLNVFDNIAFGLKLRKEDKENISSKVDEFLAVIDMKDKKYSFPNELSGGQKQRVALARSLILGPRVLLFDEPLNALDRKMRQTLQIEIRNIQKKYNITSIFVTHDLEEAMCVADEIYLMNNGVIEQDGTPQEIYMNPKTLFVADFIGSYNILTREDFAKIFHVEIDSKYIAIRPEVITIENSLPKGEYYYITGCTVVDSYINSNILRHVVQKDGIIFNVDCINCSVSAIKVNDTVNLAFHKSKCAFLNM